MVEGERSFMEFWLVGLEASLQYWDKKKMVWIVQHLELSDQVQCVAW